MESSKVVWRSYSVINGVGGVLPLGQQKQMSLPASLRRLDVGFVSCA